MNKKAVALFSGGLDSMLAILILKEQGIEIEALNLQTMFTCCKNDASRAAHALGVPLTVINVGDDYLKLVEKPKYGRGRGMNPCVDCRSYMFKIAKKMMETTGASFVASGEVLDQRPSSQRMRHLRLIEEEAGLKGLILRPLSAGLLPETEPEKQGIVDRRKLFSVCGRSREKLIELAKHYGIEAPSPSSGCALTSPEFSKKVRDIFENRPDYERWEFEILKIGRHFRLNPGAKVIIARNEEQNAHFEALHPEGTALLKCRNFGGPHALVVGEKTIENLEKAAALMLRYVNHALPEFCELEVRGGGPITTVTVPARAAASQEWLDSLRVV